MTQRILNAPVSPAVEVAVEPIAKLDRGGAVPDRLVLPNVPPLVDQGQTGTCVAHAAYGVYNWAYRQRYGAFAKLDIMAFYDLCKQVDHDPDPGRWHGTTLLTALRVMAGSGFPLVGGGRAPRIGGYHYIGDDWADVQYALEQYRQPIFWRVDWDANWMYLPRSRVLKAPVGQAIGGHALYTFGYDKSVNQSADLDRNSWGPWSVAGNGSCYFADRFKTHERSVEAWQITSIL